jgi:hypothetical protein
MKAWENRSCYLINYRRQVRWLRGLLLGGLCVLMTLCSSAAVTTNLYDNFADGDRTTGTTWHFLSTGAVATVQSGSLKVDFSPVKCQSTLVTYLTPAASPLTLAATGDKITLTFDVTFGSVYSAAGVIDFGFFNSANKRTTGDLVQNATSSFTNWAGYAVQGRVGNTGASTFVVGEHAVGGNVSPFVLTSTATPTIAGNSQISSNSYSYTLSIERTATGVILSGNLGGSNAFSVVDNTTPFYSFDTLVLGSTAGINDGSYYTLDNITVTQAQATQEKKLSLFILSYRLECPGIQAVKRRV